MAGYHTAIAFHPGTGYGVVVLMGGRYPDAAKLAYDTFEIMQPAIDKALANMAEELYVGEWVDVEPPSGSESSASIVIDKGTLYVEEFTLLGVHALKNLGAPGRLALRSSMRRDEFRCVSRFARCLIRDVLLIMCIELTPGYLDTTARSTWDATLTGTDRTSGESATTLPSTRYTSPGRARGAGCMFLRCRWC